MNDTLQDVISAAAEGVVCMMPSTEGASRRAPQLRAVSPVQLVRDRGRPEPLGETAEAAGESEPDERAHGDERGFEHGGEGGGELGGVEAGAVAGERLGRSGLRMAFWLCGFQEMLRDRVRAGEALSDREESLLALCRKDFAIIRPDVIVMAIERLDAVVTAAGERAETPMEAFALDALRALSARATDLLGEAGPERALSLFAGAEAAEEPLAIFQQVFSTALEVLENFALLIPGRPAELTRLAEALGSEVERI